MNTHPYVRAYMAGIVVPTIVPIFFLAVFIVARLVYQFPVPIERALVFPMALAPNLFGVWNMLYLCLHRRGYIPIGFHGALLPFLIAPFGFLVGTSLGFVAAANGRIIWFQVIAVPYPYVAVGFTIALIGYYLVWKYFVNFFNKLQGIA
jgi:hypothetical protein